MRTQPAPVSRRPARRQQLGAQGEAHAAAYLEQQGYALVARNWRTRCGELDIVARDGEWLVFIEVRSRLLLANDAVPLLGCPEESVTPRKQRQLSAMADAYLYEQPWDGPWRIDVIAVELRADGSVARLAHLCDAVGGT